MSISIEQQIGQLIIAGFRGMEIDPENNIAKYIQKYKIGGVILYDEDLELGGSGPRNIKSPHQV